MLTENAGLAEKNIMNEKHGRLIEHGLGSVKPECANSSNTILTIPDAIISIRFIYI